MKRYTVGFLFSITGAKVVLIRKERPAWQRGRWNGIGGKVEENETFLDCIRREFNEEAGRDIDTWEQFATLSGDDFEIGFFRAFMPMSVLQECREMTDETIHVFHVLQLPNVIPNLRWLIPMALSMDDDSTGLFQIREAATNKRDT